MPKTNSLSTKKARRTIRHSAFVSKIEKLRTKTPKRRRPSKKLVADLESLADALPDASGSAGTSERGIVVGDARVRQGSLKSRPGAMKRKGKVEKMERERFSKNMAQLVVGGAGPPAVTAPRGGDPSVVAQEGTPSTISTRWAALRGYLSQNIDRKAGFS
ncbi:MAG: hypothetical protein M1813_006588 [Trichoglossum hirsutum]|jgi:hypothetical protein|nr:MAG: hypothetical protein M1813_006588 [Trichoglossum hirsutum]